MSTVRRHPQLILFDLDGTLIDSVPDLAVAVDYALQQMALPTAGEQRVRQWVGNGAAILIERALLFACESTSRLPTEQDQQRALDYFFRYYADHCAVNTRLYPNVRETLARLHERNIVLAIVTNKPRTFVAPILQALDIAHYFSLSLGGDDLPYKKPHPAPLLHCLNELGFTAKQSLMVGDSRNDIEAAREANILVAAVDYGYNHGRPVSEEEPDFLFSDMAQLLSVQVPA